MKLIVFSLSGVVLASGAAARTFTVYNACPFTVWPGMFTDLHAGSAVPDFATGWEAPAGSKASFNVPDNWTAGRIWGRRNCDMSKPGPNNCLTGGCNGGLECDRNSGTGVPPATVAEWTLSANPNVPDNYDVSLVDGYNLPARISNNKGCPVAECVKDLGPDCPAPLKGPFDSTGFPVGCKSACVANLDGNPQNSANCCSGSHNTPETCPASGVAYYSYFKGNCPKCRILTVIPEGNCPRSYAYAYDESSGTALFTCDSNLKADYTLTFCP